MKINIIEKEKEKLKLEIHEDEGFVHLLAKKINELGLDSAAFREHPFMVQPKILVEGNRPLNALKKAAKSIENDCDELKAEFQKVYA